MSFDHETAMDLSPTYRKLPMGQREFVLAWMSDGDDSIAALSKKIGCTYSKAQRWRKNQNVMLACRELALQSAKVSDTELLVAHQWICHDFLKRIQSGEINSLNLKPIHLRIMEGAYRRTGFDNLIQMRVEENGVEKTVTGNVDVLKSAWDQLQAQKAKDDQFPPSVN